MTRESDKLKLLYLAQIFKEDTDDEHGLTMPQIIGALSECGIDAERKALYRDIEKLREFGYDIQKLKTQPVSYALLNRDFSPTDLRLLADAVQSSRFLTRKKSRELLAAIQTLGSKHESADLKRRVHVEGRVKTLNESAFSAVDTIQQAINMRRKIEFKYFKHNTAKKRVLQRDGKTYVGTPVTLVYSDDNYYAIVYSDKYEDFTMYRVDRMLNLKVSEEQATRNEKIAGFKVESFQARAFGMFNGDPVMATMLVDESVMSSVIDRFGKDVTTYPLEDGKAHVHAYVLQAPTFYSWVAQFGGDIVIEGPASLRQGFKEHLQRLMEDYKD